MNSEGQANPAFYDGENEFVHRNSPTRSSATTPSEEFRPRSPSPYAGEGRCGYGACTPSWLQRLHGPRALLASMSLLAIVQGFIINGVVPVILSTLERRFSLRSVESGVFASMYDFAVLLVLIPVSHFGNHAHKGRWLGWGMVLFAVGSFVCVVPHFAGPLYTYGQAADGGGLCDASNSTAADCDQAGPSMRNWYWVLLFGQLIHGIGASPLYTLGNVYLDENVSQRASPVYLGLYTAFGSLGPALGFVVGGFFMKIYADFHRADMSQINIDLDLDDKRWYGAWWLGFIASGILSFLFAIPMLGFARELPGAAKHRLKDVNQANDNSIEKVISHKGRDLPKACLGLLSNGTFTMSMAMQTAEAFLLNGFINFVPKLMTEVYRLQVSSAGMITGAIVIPGAFLGNVLGGFLMRRWSLKVRGALGLAMVTQVGAFLLSLGFLLQCPEPDIAGLNSQYLSPDGGPLESVSLASTCNSNCGDCVGGGLRPVCAAESGQAFFNPCYAGCRNATGSGKNESWLLCECAVGGAVVGGECAGGGCAWKFPVFVVVFGFSVLITFMATMPVQQVTIRSVPFARRSLALGLTWLFIRIFGSIPGPIFFGMAIDKSCRHWQVNCDGSQNCLNYESKNIALSIMAFAMGIKVLNVLFLSVGWLLYKAPVDSTSSARIAPVDSSAEATRF